MKHNLYKLLNLLLVILVALSFSGCGSHNNEEDLSGPKQITLNEEQEKNAKIETATLEDRLLKIEITIPAQFKAMNKFLDKIYAPIDGTVVNVFIEPGSIVKKGQPLIQIKSDAIGQIQLEFLDKYIGVDSLVNQMSAQCNLSNLTFKREGTLFHEGISSRAEYEVARAQMLKDKANLNSLKIQKNTLIQVYGQRVALYGGNAGTIRRAISTKSIYPYITLISHKNGVVLDRKINPGEIINQNRELCDIADLSEIWLVGYAFERDAPHLTVGQEIVGKFEREHGKTVKGKLSYVASMLDTDKKTLEVIADVPNPDFSIKPNMYAEMVVDVGNINTLSVPNSALQTYGDYNFAYVLVKPHVYEERKVEIGQHNDKYTQVKSGLKKGEIVVTNGGFSLLGESIKASEE